MPIQYCYVVHYILFPSILAIEEYNCARVFVLVSTAGHVALFPLLYKPAGKVIVVLLCLCFV